MAKQKTSETIIIYLLMPQTAKSLKAPNGETLGFWEYIPVGEPKGVIIFLHGQGERGNGASELQSVLTNGIPNYCAANKFPYDFIVLSPQLDRKYSSWPNWQVDEMIAYADSLKYNTSILALTGLSLGGGGTWRYATSGVSRSRITHVSPVCATGEYVDANLCSIKNLWCFHCVDDGTVTVNFTKHAEGVIYDCKSPNKKFTYYQSGGHGGAWIRAYDTGHITSILEDGTQHTENPNLYEWLLGKGAQPNVIPTMTATKAVLTVKVNGNTVSFDGSQSTGNDGISSWDLFIRKDGKYYKPVWDNGRADGSGVPINIKTASIADNGDYDVALTVQDKYGKKDTCAVVPFTISGTSSNPLPDPPVVRSAIVTAYDGKNSITIFKDANTGAYTMVVNTGL